MLTHPTLDQMASLGLTGMAAAWRALADQDPGECVDAFDRYERRALSAFDRLSVVGPAAGLRYGQGADHDGPTSDHHRHSSSD